MAVRNDNDAVGPRHHGSHSIQAGLEIAATAARLLTRSERLGSGSRVDTLAESSGLVAHEKASAADLSGCLVQGAQQLQSSGLGQFERQALHGGAGVDEQGYHKAWANDRSRGQAGPEDHTHRRGIELLAMLG